MRANDACHHTEAIVTCLGGRKSSCHLAQNSPQKLPVLLHNGSKSSVGAAYGESTGVYVLQK